MFNIDIPEKEEKRTIDDVLKHMAEVVSMTSHLDIAKHVKESVDMVIAYANKEIMYEQALTNIYEIGDGLGMKGITLGSVVVDLNEIKELMDEAAI